MPFLVDCFIVFCSHDWNLAHVIFYFYIFTNCYLSGTILGATEMVTGFPPSNLLMTSA